MITQGYLARHFQGRSGMRDPALLDVAQDYALKYLTVGESQSKMHAGGVGGDSRSRHLPSP
jgi:hypothetical protein